MSDRITHAANIIRDTLDAFTDCAAGHAKTAALALHSEGLLGQRRVTSETELNALPVGTVTVDADGRVWQKTIMGWKQCTNLPVGARWAFPHTICWEPTC